MRVVAIQHVKTRHFVAMNANGKLYCQATFNADCKFKENIFENYWNIYARLASIEDVVQNVRLKGSLHVKLTTFQKLLHIAVSAKGLPVKGDQASKDKPCAHFLPHAIESVCMVPPEIRDDSTKVSVISGNSIKKQ